MHLEGTVLVGPEFEPVEGRVIVADDEIVRIEGRRASTPTT